MDGRERQSQAARIEALLQEIAAFPDARARGKMEELLHALLNLYGEGLTRLLALTEQAEAAGQALVETFAGDELVGSLLLLHGLHPVELETRIHQALDKIRASTQARGSSLELTCIENGVAYLWLTGASHGCASSLNALKQSIEQAIYSAAPDLDEIRFEEAVPQRQAVPVRFVPRRRSQPGARVAEPLEITQGQTVASRKD